MDKKDNIVIKASSEEKTISKEDEKIMDMFAEQFAQVLWMHYEEKMKERREKKRQNSA